MLWNKKREPRLSFLVIKFFHCLEKSRIGLVANIFANGRWGHFGSRKQKFCRLKPHRGKLLSKGLSRVLNNKAFGLPLG